MLPTELVDALTLPAAILLWWAVAEGLITGLERREQRRFETRERLTVAYLWPVFLCVGAAAILARSFNNR